MNPEEISFEEFFAEQLKRKGVSLKKLTDLTGILPRHIQEIAQGNFAALPSAPYVRGYLLRLGEVLDFDGEAWWQRVKTERRVRTSGMSDSLPENRFLKKMPTRAIAGGAVALVVLIYLAFQLPKILGKPSLQIISPAANPFTANVSPLTIEGTAANADSLFVNGESVPLNSDGTWQKDILLSSGPNQIVVTAKKFLGRTTEETEEIIYEPPVIMPQTPAGRPSSSATSTP